MIEFEIGETWNYKGNIFGIYEADSITGEVVKVTNERGRRCVALRNNSNGITAILCYAFSVYDETYGELICEVTDGFTKIQNSKHKQIKSPFLMGYKIND
jgi:hypothetical protein